MRRLIVPLALALALSSGVALNETRLVALTPVQTVGSSPASSPNGVVVRRFYDAINTAIAGGNTGQLDRLVAPSFVDHLVRPGVTPDRTGLIDYLRILRTAAPTARLVVDRLFVEDDRVVALVITEGTLASPAAGIVPGAERAWGTIDVFRVTDGRITEHWGDPAGVSHALRLANLAVPMVVSATMTLRADRWTLSSEASPSRSIVGPAVLLVEHGSVSVESPRFPAVPAVVARAGSQTRPLLPADDPALATGDALGLPQGVEFRVGTTAADPAVVLVLRTAAQQPDSGIVPADMSITGRGATASPETGELTDPPLAGGITIDLPGGGMRVTVTRYSLAPGTTLAAHRVATTEFAVVSAGAALMTLGDGEAWVRDAPAGSLRSVKEAIVGPGQGAQLESMASVTYRAIGDTPVGILLITVGPEIVGSTNGPNEKD